MLCALIADATTAAAAKESLEGHCIYDGGFCKLHLTYSRHTDLNVKVYIVINFGLHMVIVILTYNGTNFASKLLFTVHHNETVAGHRMP